MGFFRATLLGCAARCTQTCLATLTVSVFLFSHLGRAFRSQFARFRIPLRRPARPLSFGQLSCVSTLVWSAVLCFRPRFQLDTPVSNLASGVRTYDT